MVVTDEEGDEVTTPYHLRKIRRQLSYFLDLLKTCKVELPVAGFRKIARRLYSRTKYKCFGIFGSTNKEDRKLARCQEEPVHAEISNDHSQPSNQVEYRPLNIVEYR